MSMKEPPYPGRPDRAGHSYDIYPLEDLVTESPSDESPSDKAPSVKWLETYKELPGNATWLTTHGDLRFYRTPEGHIYVANSQTDEPKKDPALEERIEKAQEILKKWWSSYSEPLGKPWAESPSDKVTESSRIESVYSLSEYEKERTYTYPTHVVKLVDPIRLFISVSGTHRVQTADGWVHYIPDGWSCLSWLPVDEADPVQF